MDLPPTASISRIKLTKMSVSNSTQRVKGFMVSVKLSVVPQRSLKTNWDNPKRQIVSYEKWVNL